MRTKADAARYQAEQEAAGIRARGEAEAAAIQAKAVAEAEGMEKKAEAYAKYNNAAIVEMLVGIMPQMAADLADSASVCAVYTAGSVDIDLVDRGQWLRDLCGHLRHDAN